MDGVEVDYLDIVKEMNIANIDFCKEFDKCITLYNDFLKHYSSTQSEIR